MENRLFPISIFGCLFLHVTASKRVDRFNPAWSISLRLLKSFNLVYYFLILPHGEGRYAALKEFPAYLLRAVNRKKREILWKVEEIKKKCAPRVKMELELWKFAYRRQIYPITNIFCHPNNEMPGFA